MPTRRSRTKAAEAGAGGILAKCELILHLEDERQAYRPGDVVRGSVEVRCDEEVACDGLKVGLRWKAQSKVPTDRTVTSQNLFQGMWQAGTEERYPIALELPAGPFTYQGHHLNVTWELFAEADVPWTFDPAAARDIVLEPDPDAAPDWQSAVGDPLHLPPELQPNPPDPPPTISKAKGFGCLMVLLIPMAVLLAMAAGKVLDYSRGEISGNAAAGWIFAAAVMLLFVGGGLYKVLRDVLAWGKIGQVSVEVDPRRVRAGESLQVKVSCQPRRETELLSATVRLKAEERVFTDTTNHKRSWTEVVFDQETALASACRLPKGLPFQSEVAVAVPASGPPSFTTWGNHLTWTATVRLQLAGWPDFVEDRTIQVHP